MSEVVVNRAVRAIASVGPRVGLPVHGTGLNSNT
ncbi:MAG: hypothetical protein JWO18_555 [Microbacteriaceae bacterium]|nr:hypothetical protein [Microbacteriaceae bacterium]